VNAYSLKVSCGLHGALIVAAVVLPLLPIFRAAPPLAPVDFTVVVDENLIPPNVPNAEPSEQEPEQAPAPAPELEPEPMPDVPQPEALPEFQKDELVIEKRQPDPPKKVPDPVKVKQPEKKPPEKKPEKPPEKKPFVKGKRVEAAVKQPAQPKFEELYKPFDPTKPVSVKPLTDKALSGDKVRDLLAQGAQAGTRNSVPDDEMSRCASLVKRAMYEAWEQPGAGDAGSRPALLDIGLDLSGRVVSYRIRQSSGSAFFDQTVLKAAAHAQPIRGLSVAFLRQYTTLTVEFKLE
jgi:TonB family protein